MEATSLLLTSPSGRIVLSTPSPSDDEAVAVFRSDPVVLRYVQFLPDAMSTDDVRQRRETRAADPSILDLNIFVKGEGGTLELGGSTAAFHIDDTHKSCETGILVAAKFHGQGLTAEIFYTLWTYIFEEKGFHRISLETSMQNAPMRGWLEKVAGVRLEGVKKEWWTDRVGGWLDVAGYAVLEGEWRDSVKARLVEKMESRNAKETQ